MFDAYNSFIEGLPGWVMPVVLVIGFTAVGLGVIRMVIGAVIRARDVSDALDVEEFEAERQGRIDPR